MLFEDSDLDAGAGEQKAQHHAGWSAPAMQQRVAALWVMKFIPRRLSPRLLPLRQPPIVPTPALIA